MKSRLLALYWLISLLLFPWFAVHGEIEPWSDPRLSIKPDLELWFDAGRQNAARAALGLPATAAGMPLDYLIDGSGNHRNLTQRDRDARPKMREDSGEQFIAFDGTNDSLFISGLKRRMAETTIFLVASPHSNGGGFRGLCAMSRAGQNDYTSGLNFDLGVAPTAQLAFLNVEGSGAGGIQQLFQSPPLPFGGWHMFELQSTAGERGVRVFVDAKPHGIRERKASDIFMDEFVLGARTYSNIGEPPYIQGFFHGQISEALVYNRALTDDERIRVEQYLSNKYARLLGRPPKLEGESKPLVTVTNLPPVQVFVPGFTVRELPVSLKHINNLKYRADGKLVALGYNGQIYLLTDSDGDGLEDHVEVFWGTNTLRAPIGMALTPPGYAKGQGVFVASKGKASLILDTNGDDRADEEIIVADGWKEIPHGVDALGIALDNEGNVYFGLATADFTNAYLVDKGSGQSRYDLGSERGTIIKVSPDFKHREIVCTGVRFSVALAFNAQGDLFCTDQEGATWLANGNPLDELLHIQPGRHYGFPPRHPKYLPGVIDEPSVFDYAPQHQSTCGLNFNESVNGGPTFGPSGWAGDAIVSGYSRGKIWLTKLVKTSSGYVAQTQQIASLSSLVVDACVSPQGELVVATHGGEPDWGSGPNGDGRLYKITYTDKNVPQPVLTTMPAPGEIEIAFDRPLDTETLLDLARRIEIAKGKYVFTGDRFEFKRPGYAVVYSQLSSPRREIAVQSAAFTPDARTLLIRTEPSESALNYGIRLSHFHRGIEKPGGLAQHPDVDLLVSPNGIQAEWLPAADNGKNVAWQGWLPHLDLEVSKELTKGSADHDAFLPKLSSPGILTLRGQLDLWQMLQPAIQPGSSLDYERPTEQVTLVFSAATPFKVQFGGATISSRKSGDGTEQALVKHRGQPEWIPFEIIVPTGKSSAAFTASWFTEDDSRLRAFPLRRFLLPWAKADAAPGAPESIQLPKELAGGNWARGKRLFFGDVATCYKCHVVGGEGNKVGPDLSNLAHRDYMSVLKDIRFPNAALNPDHLSYSIQLMDGEEVSGVLQVANAQAVTLADAAGRKVIPRNTITTMNPTGTSLMPEGLDKGLGDSRLKDLMTFLMVPALAPAVIHIPDAPAPGNRAELAAVLQSPGSEASQKALHILLCSGPKDHGIDEHDYPLWQERWSRLLELAENVVVTTTSTWPSPDSIRDADVIVFYSDNPGWSDARARQLQEFQKRGGGLVYIHFAVDGHEATKALSDIIGLAWHGGEAKFRHGELELSVASSPITTGLSHLHLHDESYWDLSGDPNSINVLASGIEQDKSQPLIWTRENGPGRVFVSIPGHYTWTFDDPLFRALLLRGICWAAHQPETRLEHLALIGARIAETTTGQ
jgi:putative heme-binding domain-containing protein